MRYDARRFVAELPALVRRHPVAAASVAATGLGLGSAIARGGEAEGLEAALAVGAVGMLAYAGYRAREGAPGDGSVASLFYQHPRAVAAATLGTAVVLEAFALSDRWRDRHHTYAAAQARARATGRALVVVGDPDGGAHTRLSRAYGCGDACVDLTGCPRCPRGVRADLCRGPIREVPDGKAVVFASCVLEYCADPHAAWRELLRMAGGDAASVFLVSVQPASLTAAFYPGARWTIVRSGDGRGITATPVTATRKVATGAALATVGATLAM